MRVLFSVGRDGRVLSAKVLESSGSSLPDESALLAVYGSSAPPKEASGKRFSFTIPIRYTWTTGGTKERVSLGADVMRKLLAIFLLRRGDGVPVGTTMALRGREQVSSDLPVREFAVAGGLISYGPLAAVALLIFWMLY